jgi:protein TonB
VISLPRPASTIATLRAWGLPVAASALIHAILIASLVRVGLPMAPPTPDVLPVELVTAEPAAPVPETPVEAPRPPRTLPRLLRRAPEQPVSPRPRPPAEPPPETREEPKPPPMPSAQQEEAPLPAPASAVLEPAPAPPPRSQPREPASPVTPDAGQRSPRGISSAVPDGLPAPPGVEGLPPAAALPRTPGPGSGSSATPPSPSTAAVPGGTGITRSAIPRGGYQVRPTYPPRARQQGAQGTTLLRVHIDVDGRVTEVAVARSAGHPDLDEAAAEAVRRWRFEPARRGDEPVAMWVQVPVEFRIK